MEDYIVKGVKNILKGLSIEYGLDVEDENFTDTPLRVSKAYKEIFSGIENTEEQIDTILDKSFPSDYSELIISKGIRVFSMCPHHLLPVDYTIDIGYIPDKGGRVLGISKLARIASVYAKRPVLQEQLTSDITGALMRLDKCIGAACIVRGKHYCMLMRGAKQPESVTITSSLCGVFKEESFKGSSARKELMDLLK